MPCLNVTLVVSIYSVFEIKYFLTVHLVRTYNLITYIYIYIYYLIHIHYFYTTII